MSAIMRKFTLGILLVAVVAAVGCKGNPKTSDRDVNVVDYEQLNKMLSDRKRPTTVVDVRSADKFAAGRLPMAINIPLPQIGAGDPRLAETHHIVVYSRGLGDPLSRAAAKRMLALGYANVHDFAGGLELWQRLGGPVTSDP